MTPPRLSTPHAICGHTHCTAFKVRLITSQSPTACKAEVRPRYSLAQRRLRESPQSCKRSTGTHTTCRHHVPDLLSLLCLEPPPGILLATSLTSLSLCSSLLLNRPTHPHKTPKKTIRSPVGTQGRGRSKQCQWALPRRWGEWCKWPGASRRGRAASQHGQKERQTVSLHPETP